ncbi:PQQ-binding-like beta-propeller repeat protein [Actinocorallia aurantiaca]|uniref:outer membrane protein assembly factor BamB family protein n=1 Tax=Actinocorallia aurantiaca TaxID=46204 RepID=UPI0031E2CB66
MDGTLIFLTRKEIRGVDVISGRDLWTIPFLPGLRYATRDNPWFSVARGAVILVEAPGSYERGIIRAIDPGTGRLLWSDGPATSVEVSQDAVFVHSCADGLSECTTTRREPRTGRAAWSEVPNPFGWTGFDDQRTLARPTGRYFVTDTTRKSSMLRDTRNGRRTAMAAVPEWNSWRSVGPAVVFIGKLYDDACQVELSSFDAEHARPRWKRTICFPLGTGDDYNPGFPHAPGGFIGDDTRIATLTPEGIPQILDLTTGNILWRSAESGTPLDSDGTSLLTRRAKDQGPLTMLDFPTGRALWTAPDPGLTAGDTRWRTFVNQDFTAIAGLHEGEPSVAVYDTGTGRPTGRYSGIFKGAGDGWIAVETKRFGYDLDFFFL